MCRHHVGMLPIVAILPDRIGGVAPLGFDKRRERLLTLREVGALAPQSRQLGLVPVRDALKVR